MDLGQRPDQPPASRLSLQPSAGRKAAPDPDAAERNLRFFAERDGVQANGLELALDIITPFAFELKRAASRGFIQRRHRTRQGTIFPGGNFRTGELGCRGIIFQAYDDKPSKVYGEFPCFHLEAKINGVAALRRLGINSVSDLFAFDHARLWQSHFIIAELDMERLGRHYANKWHGTKRRTPLMSGSACWPYNLDAAAGNVLWRVFAADSGHFSLQRFLKQYAKHCRCHSYVIATTIAHSATATLLYRYGVIPAPDISLLRPELRYPLRSRPHEAETP